MIVVDRKLCFYDPLGLAATIFHGGKNDTQDQRVSIKKMFLTLNLEPLAGCFETGKCTLNSKWYFRNTGSQCVAQCTSHRALEDWS